MIMSLWRKLAITPFQNELTISTHSDTTLSLLRRGGGVSTEEESVLAPWEWNHNEAFLHWDERVRYRSLLPRIS
jgi:predicted NAD/FAD-binding protein